MIEELKDSILNNNYELAEKIIQKLPFDDVRGILARLAYNTENISIYTFVISLLLKKETAELHILASEILGLSLFFLGKAYSAGLYHARKSIELEPHAIEYKEFLLFYYGLPDNVMSKEEALKIAQEILTINPKSEYALKIISEA